MGLKASCPFLILNKSFFFLSAYTYFYKGSNYWRFDNQRSEADKGYPRSILKDFMGCVWAPDPKPDTELEQKPEKPVDPSDGQDEQKEPDQDKDRDKDLDRDKNQEKDKEPGVPEEEEVNVVVTVANSESKVMTLIMVTVPLVLILGILILIYAILRTLQTKDTPRSLVHCKRSLQEWV